MTDRHRVLIGRSLSAVAILSAVAGLVWLLVLGYRSELWEYWIVHNALVAVAGGVIVWLVVPGQPRNAAVWILAWAGLFTGLLVFASGALVQGVSTLGIDVSLFDVVPADLPTWLALIAMQVNWLWMGVFLVLGILYVFPDGTARSPRFRLLFRAFLITVALTSFGLLWEARPSSTFTLGESQDMNGGFRSLTAAIVTVGYPLTFLLVGAGAISFVLRYRKSHGAERLQFRWVAMGASVAGISIVGAFVLDEVLGRLDIALYLGAIGFLALLGSVGIAIGRYRLYDVDTVISRSVVYGTLALFIGVVYVSIAVLPWVILGSEGSNNTWLGIVATVVVAVSFQPLRRRMERVANRLVYGRRATPYEVLSAFSQGISAVDPEILEEIARSLTEGTTAESASIWMDTATESHCVAAWPEESQGDNVETASVVYEGDQLGHVMLTIPPGQPFPVPDSRLLDQVAAGLGLALRNLQLTDDLRQRVDELAASRRRIVSVQDETRRKLERDLHDGAQQRLVALKIKLGIGSAMAEKSGLADVQSIIDAVREETDHTIESVRDFALGIYPPLLEAEGLAAALKAQARKMPIAVTVQAAGLERYPKDVEATIYFCVLEALQNAMKHSKASSVQVVLSESEGELSFEVRDDGVGFDKTRVASNGLINMRDRVEAVGGSTTVTTQPGHGTLVQGRLAVPELVAS